MANLPVSDDALVEFGGEIKPLLILEGVDVDQMTKEITEAVARDALEDYLDRVPVPLTRFSRLPPPEKWFEHQGNPVYLTHLHRNSSTAASLMAPTGVAGKTCLTNNLSAARLKEFEGNWISIESINDGYETEDPPENIKPCGHCRRIPKTPMGLPILLKPQLCFSELLCFVCEGIYCNYRCAMAAAIRRDSRSALSPSPLEGDSRRLLRIMFDNQFPGASELIPAPDPLKLRQYGGELTDEEYDSGTFTYQRTQNVVSSRNPITTQQVHVLYDRDSIEV